MKFTHFKNKDGYWWNKRVLSVYKDKKRTKLIKSITHETKYGKKYSFDYFENRELNYIQVA